jgi:hypothetical protein
MGFSKLETLLIPAILLVRSHTPNSDLVLWSHAKYYLLGLPRCPFGPCNCFLSL